jgi:hypothetical protein
MRRTISLAILAAALLTVVARPSRAQETEPAPVISAPRPATHGVGPGVGVTGMLLGGPAGLSLAYDGGPWHVDTMLGLSKTGPNARADFALGARFWYHLHSTTNSDFSVGGGLGYKRIGNRPPANPAITGIFIEAGGQIRVYLTSNVALSGTLGLSIATADFEAYGIGGQSFADQTLGLGGIAGVGLHYYFY